LQNTGPFPAKLIKGSTDSLTEAKTGKGKKKQTIRKENPGTLRGAPVRKVVKRRPEILKKRQKVSGSFGSKPNQK